MTKYPTEESMARLFKEVKMLIVYMKNFFFRTPTTKTEAHIYLITVVPWLLFITAIIWTMRR